MLNLRRSVFITFFSTNANTIVQFGVTIVLARLLTPAEVGIFSITVLLTNIAAVFRDFGMQGYIQREKNLTKEKIRSALGLIITTSWILAALIYLLSDKVANYYQEPGIGSVLKVLTISFVLVPFASFFYSLMARNLEAGKQAIVNGISTVSYATTAIGLAYMDFSYMALAWANVVNISASIIAYIALRSTQYSYLPSFTGWRDPIRFGSGAILGSLLDRINLGVPDIVLGKISGPHDVGLYSRAAGLVGIYQQVMGPTISYNSVPYIAHNYHSNNPLVPIIAKSTAYLTVTAWPFLAIVGIYSEDIILLLYGAQWLSAAPIVVVLCIATAVRVGYALNQASLLAIGRPYLSSITAGSALIGRLIAIYSLTTNDLYSFAIAICVADVITVSVPALLMRKYLGYKIRIALLAHWQSFKVTLPCLIVILLLNYLPQGTLPTIIQLTIITTTIPILWIYLVLKTKHPIANELKPMVNKLPPGKVKAIIERHLT